MAESKKTLHVVQVKSYIGYAETQRRTLRALGLGRIGSSNDLPDNPATRGQIFKVKHLVEVTEA
ncbi:MAG: 50S ribosomal protein L30 [Denitrobacterium sp.]|jgi:large subunit ribosomal protein L30|nr:50S ribosomal protein L30 [Denitrobacterium sp.]MCI1479267.1 50S ribosomal protein L30 [Eggerthellaceae bacterium]